ncbi:MAG: methyltransferase domain-containing protein [Candidatus Altiarchaeota archaeon]|nr:methyltransferase domain-containing protein [Candidatus Altiarchaeota archaeon]
MRYIIRFSGEHPTLPLAELKGVLEGEGIEHRILGGLEGRIALIEVDSDDRGFAGRLALSTKVCEYVGSASDLGQLADKVHGAIDEKGSFAVRCSSETLEKKFGGMLHEKGLKVDLRNPAVEVNLFKSGGKYLAGLDISLNRDYNKRRPQYRPFFSPTSMHPKHARVMVNLARVKSNDSLLDPFCGTGGILIEAGLMGVNVHGWDISERMVGGCMQNLRYYNLSGELEERDALNYSGKKVFDAIASDLPYGRASYTSDRKVDRLYDTFLSKADSLLKDGGYAVVMLPSNQKINPHALEVQEQYDIRVHKSLTRRIWVLKKPT